jgi:hypothetical protein
MWERISGRYASVEEEVRPKDFLEGEFFGGEVGYKIHNTCPTLPVRVLKLL